MKKDVLETLIDWIKEANKIVVLTGVELSAESGVPDFSDAKFNPHINDFRSSRDVRAQYWKKIKEIYPSLANAQPNPAHEALVELEMIGKLDCLFTQTKDVPECEECGGDILKPPISFPGQPPPHWEVREAWVMLHNCDLFLIVGASLDTQPVSSLPTLAKERGAKVVIISERESQADDYVDAVIYGKPSQVLPYLLKRVKEGIEVS